MNKAAFAGVLLSVFCLAGIGNAHADNERLKPFVLASKGTGTVAEKAEQAKSALTAAGFSVVGDYSPYPDAEILVVTDDELKQNAAASEHGGFGAMQRIAITRSGDEVQVSYTNPVYMANIYRMKGDLGNVSAHLGKALGRMEEFGSEKGLTASQARKYHYMIGMEYFDEPSLLAEYPTYEEAAQSVDAKLGANKNGVSKVYRVDIPGKQESVFGVALKAPTEADKYMDDKFIMSEIDFHDVKSTAHLPYEVLVSGNKVYALYARFRIAINFPDLSMMGKNSFMNIMKTPDAIRDVLKKTVQQ
ncbi:MAG TPA: hypothetical protein VMJ33_11430 [Gallionella sp.]|nr:hypothetical protein [Gallionella sp.]